MSSNAASVAAAHQRSRRFAAADPDAIREVYQTYGRLVYAVAYRVLGDGGRAEDAVEQTFVRAWQEAATDGPSRALGPWLASIARRVAIDVARPDRCLRRTEDVDAPAPAVPPSLEQVYDVWEVRQALLDLPVQDRELIRLQHRGELTRTEIASRMSIPVGTVTSRILRAHRRLATLLGRLQHG